MFRNLSSLQTELQNRLKTSSTAISSTRKTGWLNEACDDVANEFDFSHLFVTETIATVADQRKYYTKFAYGKLVDVIDQTAQWPLTQASESAIYEADPALTNAGAPLVYSLWGYEYVKAQPLTASLIRVVSTSIADTTQKVTVNGLVSGVDQAEILTLNGTTNVTGVKSFSEVYSIVKDGVTAGVVTAIAVDASSTELAKFSPSLESDEKQPIYLWPTPSDVRSVYLRGYRRPRRMVNPQDFPDMPSDFHELVLIGAVMRGHRDLFRFKVAASVMKDEWTPALEKLKKSQGNTRSNYSPVITGMSPSLQQPIGRYPWNFPGR